MLQYVISAITVLALDYVYLNTFSKAFTKQIESIQRSRFTMNMYAAVACYIFIIFGLNYFIINKKASLLDAFLLGFVIYGIFDTTTLALFKDWSIKLAVIDSVWGGILFMTTTYMTYKILHFLRSN